MSARGGERKLCKERRRGRERERERQGRRVGEKISGPI